MGNLTMTIRDGQIDPRQVSTAQFPHADMVGDVTAIIALQDALRDAVKGISWGQNVKTVRTAYDASHIDVPAGHVDADANTNAYARREAKWLCRYHDGGVGGTGKKATLEIPCANLDLLDATGTKLDLSAGAGLAFKTAFEALVSAPDGNTCVLDDALFVGRNT